MHVCVKGVDIGYQEHVGGSYGPADIFMHESSLPSIFKTQLKHLKVRAYNTCLLATVLAYQVIDEADRL